MKNHKPGSESVLTKEQLIYNILYYTRTIHGNKHLEEAITAFVNNFVVNKDNLN